MFIVIYDACVLYPAPLRDLLIRLAQTGLFQARWTDRILNECFDNILKNRPDLKADALSRTRDLMIAAVPDCLVTGWEDLENAVVLPDPDDRHIVAAAIRAHAQVIVTQNLSDFPSDVLDPLDIEAQHPDEFIHNLVELNPVQVTTVVRQQQEALANPATSYEELLEMFLRLQLVQTVTALRDQLAESE